MIQTHETKKKIQPFYLFVLNNFSILYRNRRLRAHDVVEDQVEEDCTLQTFSQEDFDE